jgi:hypothetical protein
MIIIILILVCIWIVFPYINKKKPVLNRKLLLLLLSIGLILIGLRGGGPVLTSIGGLLGILATIFTRMVTLLPNILLTLRLFLLHKKGNHTSDHNNFSKKMTIEEAREILGVQSNATKEEIIKAYKSAILRNHPDKGGSNYLASKINEAKKILLSLI